MLIGDDVVVGDIHQNEYSCTPQFSVQEEALAPNFGLDFGPPFFALDFGPPFFALDFGPPFLALDFGPPIFGLNFSPLPPPFLA